MTLRERLAHLNLNHAIKILSPHGDRLIAEGGKMQIDPSSDIELASNIMRVRIPSDDARVTIMEDSGSVHKLRVFCSACSGICAHAGAAFSMVLENKDILGLSKSKPVEENFLELTDTELEARELMRRKDRAAMERMRITSADSNKLWTDYTVTNSMSGKSYRVALRGWERGDSYCSCPDFRKNTLGTCKHIIKVTERVKNDFTDNVRRKPYVPSVAMVHLRYGRDCELFLTLPDDIDAGSRRMLAPFTGKPITDVKCLVEAVSACTTLGNDIIVYPDAERYISSELHRLRTKNLVKEIRHSPASHPLRKSLLKVELLPYQLDGIAFALGAGRAVIADDMGLGKTIQAIGFSELLVRECRITRVLIVCPASVKAQWRSEILKFTGRESNLVYGVGKDRFSKYNNSELFTVCNYEQVLHDLQAVEQVKWDLIVLDEGQRIKNWEAKTSRTIKALRSPYALVLSGTPLENNLKELYSVVEFIDDRRLGPDFRFHHHHVIEGSKGRIEGYKNLDALRNKLKPVLIRRTRGEVIKQLPPRTTDIIRITPTQEQLDLHAGAMRTIQQIIRRPYLTEMDMLRLRKALLCCRMSADSTFLVNKEAPGYSTKLERLGELLPRLSADKGRKTILFSEWTTMLDLIEKTILKPGNINFVRLDGSVPQKKRQALVNTFQNNDDCCFFITTNAGATGLNLQAANTVVNVDLPWNPAILEQRIGRAHRMGQKRPVHVYVLVTENTIEEGMLKTLAAKKDLALAALDSESTVTQVNMQSGIEELKRRLEILLGNAPEKPVDESERQRVETEAATYERKARAEAAGGNLLAAAFSFMGTFLPEGKNGEPDPAVLENIRKGFEQCADKDKDGGLTLKFRMPDSSALDGFARAMASFMSVVKG